MAKINIAVLFGGRSAEHEISIITGIQILNALDKSKYTVYPVYISKDGEWFLGDQSFYSAKTFTNLENLKKHKRVYLSSVPGENCLVVKKGGVSFGADRIPVDVLFPSFHGTYGEDGSMQGLFELAGIPYVGCGVQASAVSMDKMLSKRVCESIGVPVLPANWGAKNDPKVLMKNLKYPVYVKPVHLGSSIGITRANNDKELKNALDVAFFYDAKVMVEEGMQNHMEVNISIMGNNPYQFSVCETPVSSSETLSFEDKYMSSGGASKGMASLKRIIPAPIKKGTEDKIKEFAQRFFSEIDGEGLCRIDFLVSKDEKRIFLNEINPLPGSIAFYLWEKVNMPINKLVDRLVELAFERHAKKSKLTTTFQSNVLEGFEKSRSAKT